MGISSAGASLGGRIGHGGRSRFRRVERRQFLRARRGDWEPLWDFQTGGAITANPISFLIDDRQHVAIAAGQALFVFGAP